MAERIECIVIGAGVVGLACARELALAGREVVVVDKNPRIGEETSSRNSEVIHAGIYYPTGSLKAKLCVEGKQLLYDYCEAKGVAAKRLGKVIVAVDDGQAPRLDAIARQAAANGVDDLKPMDARALAEAEPEVRGAAGLFSPSTGIVDAHALMVALNGDLEGAGGHIAVQSGVERIRLAGNDCVLSIAADGDISEVRAGCVVNAAGLHAAEIAKRCEGFPDLTVPEIHYAKGSYFVYQGKSPFKHLVYPLPVDGGLGIHATLDMSGRVRFGPDVEWTDTIDYSLDPSRADQFYAAIRSYWPALADGSLDPGYVGIRPKLSGPGEPAADFMIERVAGGPRFVQLFGIESPGLTASLAIARRVRRLLDE